MTRAAAAVCVGALALAGCKCGSDAALRDVLDGYCEYIERCPDQVQFPIAYRSRGECVDILQFATTCHLEQEETPSGDRVPKVVQTMLSVDSAQASACREFLRQASCTETLGGCDRDTDAGCNPCTSLFGGSGGNGAGGGGGGSGGAGIDGPCADDVDCSDGLYCLNARSIPDGGETCRVCKPLRGPGGDCADPPYVACAKGLFCESPSGECVALRAAGATCTFAGQCLSTFCSPTTHQCGDGGKPGDTCAAAGDCRQGYCDGTCKDRKQNGATCASSAECAGGLCDMGTGRCGKPDGATCSSSYECQGFCDSTARMCRPGLADGASCMNGEQCQSKFCHGQRRVCGSACPSTGDCPAGQFCDSYGGCTALLGDGAQCRGDDECTSGFCNSDDRCAVKPGIGSACANTGDCLPKGFCSNGTCTAYVKPGEACASLESCAPPFLCTDGTCQLMSLSCEPAKVGSQCTWLQVCEDSAFCDVLNGFKCAPKKPLGESCLRSLECAGAAYCERGTCTTRAKVGESCDRADCELSLFCDESVNPNLCSGPKPTGASCGESSHCESRDCSGGLCAAPCVPVPPGDQPACHPTKCADLGFNCGSIDAGCGLTVTCGNCTMQFQTCGGGGQTNVCGCTPTRACLPRECGKSVDDGCGNMVACSPTCAIGTCGPSSAGVCGCLNDRTAGPSVAGMGASTVIPQMGAGFAAWDSVDRVTAIDDAGAHVRITQPTGTRSESQFLLATGFGFNLPPTASVNGIEVHVRREATGIVDDAEIALFTGGVRVAQKSVPFGWDVPWAFPVYGGDNDLWQYPLTVAQVNASDFGVGVRVRATGSGDAYVDAVTVIVHYAYRCDCSYACIAGSDCGSDGCGGTCGNACANDAGICANTYCQPYIFVDPATGLMWTNDSFDYGSCASVNLGGFTGWRAPTIDELRALVTGCPATAPGGACPVSTTCTAAGTCLDAGCDGCAYQRGPSWGGCYLNNHTQWPSCYGAGALWSSTRDGTQTWALDFSSARIALVGAGTMARYRCVRP